MNFSPKSIRYVATTAIVLSFAALPLLAADVMSPPTTATASTLPATKPTPPKPTAEQAAVIKKVRDQSPDQPLEKIDIRLINKDGSPNSNFGKIDRGFQMKHEANLKRIQSGQIDLLFLGDSITDWFTTNGRDVWKRYAPMNPADFGIAGDRTEHVLWRMDHGELDGISPKVVVLMIGTNDIGAKPDQILAADTKIVQEIHDKLPNTKVLLLGIFPRGVDPSKDWVVKQIRTKITAVNAGLAKLDDGNKTRYLDIGDKFLNTDGVITKDVMADALHPTAKGYAIWADAMEGLLGEMMK